MHHLKTSISKLAGHAGRMAGLSAKAIILPLLACGYAAAKPKLPVLAFYTEWNAPGSVDYSKITHLLLAFSLPQGGGNVTGFVPGGVVSAAHAAGVKVLASVGGANHGTVFPPIAANAGSRTTFANSLKAICDNNGLDGVDIDWEYPQTVQDSANFTLLLKAVRAAVGSKLLTIDVAADGEKGAFIHKTALLIPDFVNVMSYDFTGSFPGSLVGQHSPYAKATSNLNYWRAKGVPKEKLILGVPFYGKDFNAGGAPVGYNTVMANNPGLSPDADSVGRTWFNGVTTIKKKATYVAQMAYGGAMIWEIAQDAGGSKSLLEALNVGLQATPLSLAADGGRLQQVRAGESFGIDGKVWLSLSGTRSSDASKLSVSGTGAAARDVLGHYRGDANASTPASGAYFLIPGSGR
ncbi:MAG: chitinase [Fibrobacteres bacterium]|nr:chitinase [Fibrobacterota bacterium]